MKQVIVDAAGADLPRLIEAAVSGEDVVIARDGAPMVRLVPVGGPARPPAVKRKFIFGLLEGKLGEVPDFLAPLDEEELRLWEGGE